MQGWLIWFALTAAFSLMGVGMASWQSGMAVGGALVTAEFDVYFVEVNGQSLGSGAKTISIDNSEVKPGETYDYSYSIRNDSTIPVSVDITHTKNGDFLITHDPLTFEIEASSTITKHFTLKVSEDVEHSTEEASVDFQYRMTFEVSQWNY